MINVALLGCGTVGSGVYQILEENFDNISKRTGNELNSTFKTLIKARRCCSRW